MRKLLLLLIAFALSGMFTPAFADGCYICTSSSKNGIQQCQYGGSDTSSQRKKCKKAGCVIGGTSSCSSAANVKKINPN